VLRILMDLRDRMEALSQTVWELCGLVDAGYINLVLSEVFYPQKAGALELCSGKVDALEMCPLKFGALELGVHEAGSPAVGA
jgi:hypothetical protein